MNIALVVGLGNPGSQYTHTRHNAGFWLVEQLSTHYRAPLRDEPRFFGATARIQANARDWRLLKPSTFMNLSGQSVGALAQFYKIPPESILIIHDELDLPPGKMKLKQGGGHGGHNGLKSIQAQLGTADFWRLRIGIGHPGHRDAVTGFVLGIPPAGERDAIHAAIDYAITQHETLLFGDTTNAVNTINSFIN
ncbi:aminoacyl-tRNA hydrolase [Halothiobacillus sp. DCM-1]|uniref:aminoacyl-tRNA hydrolase n=1 Tax=Halothiobacillus sp. DCM-1 TaxID=3112558 RepID=UPI00324798B3